jgi:hydroxylamine reductase (hybrid-cluster protein)
MGRNTGAYGTPVPTKVTTNVASGPFIVVTGHDLRDLDQLLEQTAGTGSPCTPMAKCSLATRTRPQEARAP